MEALFLVKLAAVALVAGILAWLLLIHGHESARKNIRRFLPGERITAPDEESEDPDSELVGEGEDR